MQVKSQYKTRQDRQSQVNTWYRKTKGEDNAKRRDKDKTGIDEIRKNKTGRHGIERQRRKQPQENT